MEFVGDFFNLADFFHDVKRFVHVANSNVIVNGRLVTIDSVSYASDPQLFPRIRAEITATVYLSPKTQGVTAGATPQGPAADHSGHDAARRRPHGGNAHACPDRHGDPIGNVMKNLLCSISGTTCRRSASGPWPWCSLVALVAVPVALSKARHESSAPAPVRNGPGPKPDGLKAARQGQARATDEVGDGSSLGAFDPSNPFEPPKKVASRRRPAREPRRPAPTAATPAGRATPAPTP